MNRERRRGSGGRTREDDVRGMQEEEEEKEEEEETAALESFIVVFTFTSSELDSPLPFLCLFSISLQLISFVSFTSSLVPSSPHFLSFPLSFTPHFLSYVLLSSSVLISCLSPYFSLLSLLLYFSFFPSLCLYFLS